MKTSTIITVLVALIIIVGGWYWYANYYQAPAATPQSGTTVNTNPNGTDYSPNGGPGSQATTSTSSSNNSTSADINAGVTASVGAATPTSATITLTANGFSPKTVTIKKGGTVTFVNQAAGGMWIGSDEHPTHTEYDGTTRSAHCAAGYTGAKPFDQCSTGNSYSFTFTKSGSFDFHNHLQSNEGGTVTVVE